MHDFKDAFGRRWKIELRPGIVELIKRESGIDFTQALVEPVFQKLADDPTKFVEVLFYAVMGQANERGVSYKSFIEGLRSVGKRSPLTAAGDALLQATLDLFPGDARGQFERMNHGR